nr:small ribosomal subunit biogenesis GTPase RsgA 2-like [Nerophis lumbriciformis]
MGSIKQSLTDYGWSDVLRPSIRSMETDGGHQAGRVVLEHRDAYRIVGDGGERSAVLAGRLRQPEVAELPAVGDWVVVDGAADGPAVIHGILPRRSQISLVGLDGDFNVRRLERLLAMAWQSGAEPVVLLTKADLEPEHLAERREQAEAVAPGLQVLVLSSYQGLGLDQLEAILRPAATYALVGSSGPSHRSGAIVGRPGSSHHHPEPGCAVLAVVADGELDPARLDNYRGLQREARFLELRQDEAARRADRKRTAAIHKAAMRLKPRR